MYDGWEPLRDENDPKREKMLGKGGQGEVYLARSPEQRMKRKNAEQLARHQLVQVGGGQWEIGELAKHLMTAASPDPVDTLGALKKFIIPSENKEEEAKAIGRLESEVAALTALKDQSGILKLLHANVTDRFIVTEFHPRGTLNQHLNLYKGDALKALEAFRPLVDAVRRIHDMGAIHRDIKTENIFVTVSGSLVLGDFGIVFLQDGSERLTTTYERVGSRYWIAPWADRHARLELSKINPALDIFPLAKVLWSMIAGQNGFPYWEYDLDENNLEKLFPRDPFMSLINKRILSKRIVRHDQDCDGSANTLSMQVDGLINYIQDIQGYRPAGAEVWPCRICGRGIYKSVGPRYQLKGFREGGPVNEQEKKLLVSICDYCGHAELFAN
ncbi:MAG: protein kinase [Terracidiphilus sp.]